MRVLTAHRSVLPTRNVAWRHVPSVPPAPLQQLPPVAEEGESTAGKTASGNGTPSQGEGRVEYLYSEFGLDMEVWPPVPPATLKAPTEEHGAGAGGDAEGNPRIPSVSPGRVNFGDINGSSSSNSDDSCTSSDTSNSNDSGDLSVVVGRSSRDLEVFGELHALQSWRTRSHSRGLDMSSSCADALLASAMRTKRTVEEKAAKIKRALNSLLVERLEKEREWLEELERHGALLEQREEEQGSDCPLAMAAEQQPELSIPSPIGMTHSEVESPPPHCCRGRTVCLPEGLGLGHAIRVRGAH